MLVSIFVIAGWTFFSTFSDIFIGIWANNSHDKNKSFTYIIYFTWFGIASVIFKFNKSFN